MRKFIGLSVTLTMLLHTIVTAILSVWMLVGIAYKYADGAIGVMLAVNCVAAIVLAFSLFMARSLFESVKEEYAKLKKAKEE